MSKLFSPAKTGSIDLKNRIVMAPMTRCRAIQNIPNALIAKYYEQRAGAGLIITEGTSPSLNGLGYARIPGIFNQDQINGWKLVTSAVHQKGSKIVIQIMHTGRISHALNLPQGGKIVAPSAVEACRTNVDRCTNDARFPSSRSIVGRRISINKKRIRGCC